MPDRRQHRGSHPADPELFAPRHHAALRSATADLSWLLGRGYSRAGALKLVGDRHQLTARQRMAVRRSACADADLERRRAHRLECAELAGRELLIDGLNCLITIETALSGGLVLVGRDGVHRDLASVHGTYRAVTETVASVRAIGRLLAECRPASIAWLLNRPVSNSGRLRALLISEAEAAGWAWSVDLLNNPDKALVQSTNGVAATSDGEVLDRARRWVDLPGAVISRERSDAWLVSLASA